MPRYVYCLRVLHFIIIEYYYSADQSQTPVTPYFSCEQLLLLSAWLLWPTYVIFLSYKYTYNNIINMDKIIFVHASQRTPIHARLCFCWASAAGGGPTIAQHWLNALCLLWTDYRIKISADTRRWTCWSDVGLALVPRRRRWTNVKPTLIQRLVSTGI